MKQFLTCALVLLGAAVTYSEPVFYARINPYILEDVINGTFENMRADIPETLSMDDYKLEMDSTLLMGNADLSSVQITGLHEFEVTALNLALVGMRLNFTLVVPVLNVNTDYKADMLLDNLLPLYGDGKLNIHLVDLELTGSAQANLTGGVQLNNLLLEIYLGESTFDIHGFIDNENFSTILSELLNDMVTSLLDNHQEAITTLISPTVETIVNAFLANADISIPERAEFSYRRNRV